MQKKYIVTGGKELSGEVTVSGAKNVALKAIVAACLTNEEVTLHNMPLISDVFTMLSLVKEIGGIVHISEHSVKISVPEVKTTKIPLDKGAKIRTSTLFLAPLLARAHTAIIPNPGGCRIGARPIDRIIGGLESMGVEMLYNHEDGFFHASAKNGLIGGTYEFTKNSHTGTETLILAAVLADGTTIIENAALEPEVDSLILLVNQMGAKVKRLDDKKIEIIGVKALHGAEFTLPQDRNEVVTFAIASVLTGGKIWIQDVDFSVLDAFLEECEKAGIDVEKKDGLARFYTNGMKAVDVVTSAYPGFMTDWQGPWAIAMTQAMGTSIIHEGVYENRFGYKTELEKMGAEIEYVSADVEDPEDFYNFNFEKGKNYNQKVKIIGPANLHDAVLNITDLRAGATVILAALIAKGTSVIYGVEQVERGYEHFVERLNALGATIIVEEE